MQNNSHQKEVALLIPSCDKYSDVWPYFFKLLFKYWPEVKNHKIYLLSNHASYPDPNIINIGIGKEKSWSDNVDFALKQIDADYILVILEDFLLTAKVDIVSLEKLFCGMKEKAAGYLRLMANPPPKAPCRDNPHIGIVEKGEEYRTSLQAAIWRKTLLQKILLTGESPWGFEFYGAARSDSLPDLFLSITKDIKQPIPYFPNTIVRGLWVPQAIQHLRQEGFNEYIKRPIEQSFKRFWRENKLRLFLYRNCLKPLKLALRTKTAS